MDEADDAIGLDQCLSGHAPHLEQLNLLPVQVQHGIGWIGQAGEGKVVVSKVFAEGGGIFRSDDQYDRILFYEFLLILAQLRHVRAAERSDTAAIEH